MRWPFDSTQGAEASPLSVQKARMRQARRRTETHDGISELATLASLAASHRK
jgi:hypothetical protein